MQQNIKFYLGNLMKFPGFFHIAIYIAGLKKNRNVIFFQYRAALVEIQFVTKLGVSSLWPLAMLSV